MPKPLRLQRRRTRGYRLPPNTVCVTRPGIFGNPFAATLTSTVELAVGSEEHSVRLFDLMMKGDEIILARHPWATEYRNRILSRLPELRGKNLACFCAIGKSCHADVLLKLANAPLKKTKGGKNV